MLRLFILALLLIPVAGFSQDIIFLKSGEEINSVIQKVTTDSVVYRKPDTDTLIHRLSRSEVFMIKYQNGRKELFPSNPSGSTNSSLSSNTAPIRTRKNIEDDFLNQPIEKREDYYLIGGFPYSPYRLTKLLEKEKDPAVSVPIKSYKSYTKITHICAFGSIPFSIAAPAFLMAGIDAPEYYRGRTPNPYRQIYFTGAATSAIIFIGLQTTQIVLTKVHRKAAFKKAVEAHNKRIGF